MQVKTWRDRWRWFCLHLLAMFDMDFNEQPFCTERCEVLDRRSIKQVDRRGIVHMWEEVTVTMSCGKRMISHRWVNAEFLDPGKPPTFLDGIVQGSLVDVRFRVSPLDDERKKIYSVAMAKPETKQVA